MNNLKRVLGLVMAVAMMLSVMAFGTSAAFNDQDKIENETAVDMCAALNIINGYQDGSFGPKDTVTRAQMAKMISIAATGGNIPAVGTKAKPTYNDIKGHWAESYIEYCASLGIISGVGNGKFAPNQTVTGTQAAKMMLVVIGYDAAAEGFTGANWSNKINGIANEKSLYYDVAVDPNAPLSRDNAAQMIWNTLKAKMVKYEFGIGTQNGSIQTVKIAQDWDPERTLLSSKFSEEEFDGQLVKFSYNTSKKEFTYTVDPDYSKSNDELTFTSTKDFTALYGQNVNVVCKMKDNGKKIDKVFNMYADECRVLFSGVVNDMDVKDKTIKIDGTTYDLDYKTANDTLVYNFSYNTNFADARAEDNSKNKATAKTMGEGSFEFQKPYSFSAIDSDDDGDVNFLVLYPYTVKKVTYVGNKNVTAGSSYSFADDDIYNGIKKNDWAKITAKENSATETDRLDPVDKMLSGKVTSRSNGDYYIDKVCYNLASGVTMNVGDNVKDAPVVNGFIFDGDSTGSTCITDYALVISTAKGGIDGTQAKLLFTDGTKKVVDTDKDYTGILDGTLVTYTIDSDKDYALTAVNFSDKGSFNAVTNKDKIDSKDDKVKYLDGYNVADDAVIFVQEGTSKPYDYSVISGSKLLSTKSKDMHMKGAFADSNSSSGYYTAKLAYVTSAADLSTADTKYGYVLKVGEVKNTDNQYVCEFTIWNGTKEETIRTTSNLKNDALKADKGDVIDFSLNTDGVIDGLTVYNTDPSGVSANVCAITAYDGDFIQINGGTDRYEIDSKDTTIIYIDMDGEKGVEGGEIQLANDTTTKTAYTNDGKYWYANALVVDSDNDDTADLIVVDTNNDMLDAY